MSPFLITGLPRSRTAWLSVLCTTGNSLCYHDAIGKLRQIEDLRGLYDKPSQKFIGVADSALGFFMPWIMDNIRPRTVIIDRPIEEVRQSLHYLGMPRTNYVDLLHEHLQRIGRNPLVLRVSYHALDRPHVIQKIFWHLMPGEIFDHDRYELLAKMYIVHDLDHTAAELMRSMDNLNEIMKTITPQIRSTEAAHDQNYH